jgi:hypothetical protein
LASPEISGPFLFEIPGSDARVVTSEIGTLVRSDVGVRGQIVMSHSDSPCSYSRSSPA